MLTGPAARGGLGQLRPAVADALRPGASCRSAARPGGDARPVAAVARRGLGGPAGPGVMGRSFPSKAHSGAVPDPTLAMRSGLRGWTSTHVNELRNPDGLPDPLGVHLTYPFPLHLAYFQASTWGPASLVREGCSPPMLLAEPTGSGSDAGTAFRACRAGPAPNRCHGPGRRLAMEPRGQLTRMGGRWRR
jgi:hypothetical protein